MLWNASNLSSYNITSDGELIGTAHDFLFSDRDWRIRWVVVDTGGWLTGKQVLVPPGALQLVDEPHRSICVSLTKEQLENSPDRSEHLPVSRQHEAELFAHYRMAPYWAAPVAAGAVIPPPVDLQIERGGGETLEHGDASLRSCQEVIGYYVHASDGEIGHVEDLLISTSAWAIHYLVVDTVNWWPGRKVVVSPRSFTQVDWEDKSVSSKLTRAKIKGAPEYHREMTVDGAYEEKLLKYYGYMPFE
jgi:uncharacterized protein YrrD